MGADPGQDVFDVVVGIDAVEFRALDQTVRYSRIENGFSVAFHRLEDLLAALKRDADVSPQRLRRRKHMNVAMLVIDEVGFEPMTRQEASLFFRLVSYRYGRGSILITTNKGIQDWPEAAI